MIKHLRKNKNSKLPKEQPNKPKWVSSENISEKAYDKILQLEEERTNYIKLHSKATDYKLKKNWQISGASVAKEIGCATTTLTQTSSYSEGIRKLLLKVNKELAQKKEKRVKKHLNILSSSKKNNTKNTLLEENKSLSEQVLNLEKNNVEEQWHRLMEKIDPQIKDILGIGSTVANLNKNTGKR